MTSYARYWMALSMIALSVAAEPVRVLPPPPEPILDLRANAAGDLYVRTATKVLWMDLRHPQEGWNALPLDGVVDLAENAGREVFARQDLNSRFAIHRLTGGEAKPVTTAPHVPCVLWYVDALGRVWLQAQARLLVVGKEETLFDTPVQRLGTVFRQPCEWQPGHLALICGTEAIWASPEAVTVDPAPPFAGDATCVGPYRLGKDRLLAGCDRKSFRVSAGLVDPRKPAQPPERLTLGWDWFYGMVTAPDGRLLVLGQTDRDPQFTFFWYAADGRSQVRLKGADSVIRAGRAQHWMAQLGVAFTSNSIGFAAISDGTLAVFGPDEASLVTPNRGLPIPRVEHVATVGNDLIMAGGGKIAVWRTTEPLLQPAEADLREWPVAGPCVRDVNGKMCAFLLDFPGKLSRHDGTRWEHIDIELGNRNPFFMTGDDKGRLQIGFMDAPSGSYLVTGSTVTNWSDHNRAWTERFGAGPAFFRDGSPFRPRHVVAGKEEWVWMYDGRTLKTGQQEYDYYDSPPYNCFWLGTGGVCYRGGGGRVWGLVNGRWTETEAPPLTIGPDGIRADAAGKDRLPVVYDGQMKLPLQGPSAGSKSRSLMLQGNEAFIPAADGGGWVGQNRIFRNAYYPLAGRVYPGTNGHYLVADKTLRFQPRQTLTVTGEVVSTGKVQRLVCRIAGSEPLHQPRILVFLDGEFLDGVTAPEGADLPPVQPGAHTLDVYAADGFGVVSEQPLRLTLDGGPEFEVVHIELGEEWNLKPRRLQALPVTIAGRSVLGRELEIDSGGVVWVLVEGGVISIDLAQRQAAFHRCPVQELVGSAGRVWARGNRSQDRLNIPLYELRRTGVRHAIDLYDDSSYYTSQQISADGSGGIWALGLRSAVRWDGKQIRQWDRPLAFDARVEPSADGAIIHTRSHYLIYRNGELSQPIPWSGDFKDRWQQADRNAYPLGNGYLVLTGQRMLLEAESGRLSERKIPFGDAYRAGPNGSLYAWKGKQFYRISGDDLAVTQLVYSAQPTMPPYDDPGGYEFLATTNGVVAYTVRSEKLFIGRADEGTVEYGWQHGVQPGRTHAIRQAPDGRIWIMRQAQLLVYDPTQPADAIPSPWPGWRAAPVQERFAVGAFGRVWYGNPERSGFTSSDGTNDLMWAQRYPGANAIIVSDNGAAAIGAGTDTYLLSTGKPPERVQNLHSAVLELVKRGARSFEGDGAPAVAADGRVYFGGKIWDGQAWQSVPDGRPSLDPRGELFLLCSERSSLPVAYRLDGVKAVPLGQVEKCLIDAYGLRWFDAGLLEAQPGCLPVWYASKDTPEVSSAVDAPRVRIDPHGSLQALPLGDGQFLMRVGAKLHRLDARGLTRIPGSAVPCGDELDPGWGLRVWPLAAGRWALAVHSRLYISPPDVRFSP